MAFHWVVVRHIFLESLEAAEFSARHIGFSVCIEGGLVGADAGGRAIAGVAIKSVPANNRLRLSISNPLVVRVVSSLSESAWLAMV